MSTSKAREFEVPKELEASIAKALATYRLDLGDSKELARNVLKLSDYFIQNPEGQTPWHEPFAQIAYLCYYLPLNSARLNAVIQEASKREYFTNIENIIDFGAGLATASMSLSSTNLTSLNSQAEAPHPTKLGDRGAVPASFHYTLIEKAIEPKNIIQKHFSAFQNLQPEWLSSFSLAQMKSSKKDPKKTLALFSYSLTELRDLPDWALECEAILITEPSTQQDGRKLLEVRNKLLKIGYHVWSPCTHEEFCPLLSQSKHDWCHDRIHFKAPEWVQKMEENLPMKNRTLTMSYLLMRKEKPKKWMGARVVGDTLKEKGKHRQMICRGPDREFLAWMLKTGNPQEIPRGTLIEVPTPVEKISNELRLRGPVIILD